MAPQNLAAESINATSVRITWTEIPVAYRYGVIIHCALLWKKSDDISSSSQNRPVLVPRIPSSPMAYVLSGLESYTSYEVQIACSTKVGSSPSSSILTFFTGEGGKNKKIL